MAADRRGDAAPEAGRRRLNVRPHAAYLAAGLRRFLVLLAGIALVTTLGSLSLAFLARWNAGRAVSVGFDLVGALLITIGFFVGNRGPARLRGTSVLLFGERKTRWATPGEREEAITDSAIFVIAGFALILIGIAIDSRHNLV